MNLDMKNMSTKATFSKNKTTIAVMTFLNKAIMSFKLILINFLELDSFWQGYHSTIKPYKLICFNAITIKYFSSKTGQSQHITCLIFVILS